MKWVKHQVGDDGFITLVDFMGSDDRVVQAARISHAADQRPNEDGTPYTPKQSRRLIRHMMRHHHGTPFEHPVLSFLVRCPIYVARQWMRHRTQSYNEASQRYSQAIDSAERAMGWRAQAANNKQGSDGLISIDWPKGWEISEGCLIHAGEALGCGFQTPQDWLEYREGSVQNLARQVYEERVNVFGVAKEQARKDLPVSTYTEFYATANLRNWLQFLALRMDPHAQIEIREFADIIGRVIEGAFPICWEAFTDYVLKSITLSRMDCEALALRMSGLGYDHIFDNKRERDEFEQKVRTIQASCSPPVLSQSRRSTSTPSSASLTS